MKKIISILLFAFFFASNAISQTSIVFHENFDLPSLGDSVSSICPYGCTNNWALTNYLKYSGEYADSLRVIGTTYLTTNSFSTLGLNKVYLKFAQICKVSNWGSCYLLYSIDGGVNWNNISWAFYKGGSTTLTDKFSEYSYPDLWHLGDTLNKPDYTWWRNEIFDLSTVLANKSNVKIRFYSTDAGHSGPEGRYGWLLDDIRVEAANNELLPPVISLKNPILYDTLYVTSPLKVNAWVSDNSTITSVYLNYSVNGGSNISLPMTYVSDSLYTVNLPSIPLNSSVCYSLVATDIYNNTGIYPYMGCQQFYIKQGNPNVQIGTGTSSGYYSPVYVPSATASSQYSYYTAIFTKAEINSGGIIESLAFNKTDAYGYISDNATMRIYIKNTSNTNTPYDLTNYNLAKTGAILFYESTTQNLNKSAGWQTFACNTGNPFTYPGNENLMIFVEFYYPGNATGAINWQYTTASYKALSLYGASPTQSLSYVTEQRANMKINFESGNGSVDAKVNVFSYPVNTFSSNSGIPVSVKIKNLGTSPLTSTRINWSVDDIYQGFVMWNGSLNQDYISSDINLGNFTFSYGSHTLKAWTELPNNVSDFNPSNDTLIYNIQNCHNLIGSFTVGNSTADFPTFSDLFNAISKCGISGPVSFKIKSGTYNQQLIIPILNNSSSSNKVTLESETGNPDDVKFIFSSSDAISNYVLKLAGCSNVLIKNITFKATGTIYSNVVVPSNGASYNTVEGCRLEMPIVTTANSTGIYSDATSDERYNTFKNNTILNGYTGINFTGVYGKTEKGNLFEGNTISGFYLYGIYLKSEDSTKVISNNISNPRGATAYGIFGESSNNSGFQKNKITMNGSGINIGIYLNYESLYSGNCIIANNFISQSVGNDIAYGITLQYCHRIKVYNNSVSITKGSASSIVFSEHAGGNVSVYNNIFSNTGGGYVYSENSSSIGIDSSNYNNLYSIGSKFGLWGLSEISSFSYWVGNSGKDQNSLNKIPYFKSENDLHIFNAYLNKKGKALTEITDDIDGELRISPPCIGADEFPVPQNDAGIVMINQPQSKITNLTQAIKVSIQNLALLPLTSAIIKCSVNGVMMQAFTYTGNLPQFGVDSVIIGTFTFSPGNSQIKVWTELPNNAQDTNKANDTLSKSVYACTSPLSGNYTIGGSNANFSGFNDAIQALAQCGVGGAVTLNVAPGIYNEQISIPSITGASVSNTVTFKSATNDSTSVIINYASNSLSNWVVKFDGADYVTFKNFRILPLDSTYSKAILLSNSATYNTISGNHITGYYGTADNQVLITNETGSNYNTVFGNLLEKGSEGIKNGGLYLSVIKNRILESRVNGISCSNVVSITIDSNFISSSIQHTTKSGLYLYYTNNNSVFSKNTIHISGGASNYGIYVYYCASTNYTVNGLITNNFITINGTTGSNYGIYMNSASRYRVYFNSILVNANDEITTCAINVATTSTNNELINNILQSNKYPVYVGGSSVTVSNNNNFYTTGNNLAYWGTTSYTNLRSLTAATLKDSNSFAINPQFISTSDLHSTNISFYNMGKYISNVTTDIDGQLRSNPPGIGADEINPPQLNAAISEIITPIGGCGMAATEALKVVIKNEGFITMNPNTYSVTYKKDGETPLIPETINRTILPGDTIQYTFTTPVDISVALTHRDSIFKLKTWIEIPGDYAHANDTLSKSISSLYMPVNPVIQDITIPYSSRTTLTAISSDSLFWYTNSVGGTLFNTGKTYTTPILFDTVTYYVEAKVNTPDYIIIKSTGAATIQQWPFYSYFMDSRTELLYKAYELQAQNLKAGNIVSIAFDVTTANSIALNGFTVKMQNYTPNSLSTFNNSGWQTVYSGIYSVQGTGWQTIQLQTPFEWDGVSNLLISICYNNSSYTSNSSVNCTNISNCVFHSHSDLLSGNGCNDITSGSVYSDRPNIKINLLKSNCTSNRVPVNVNVAILSKEAGISSISTSSGCRLNQEAVTISIFNNGSDTINDNITATYKLKNGDFITPENVTIPIPPFDTIQYTFTTLANLVAPTADTLFTITAKINLVNDIYSLNDTLVKDSILSRYTPPIPVLSNISIPYGATAVLTTTSPNTLYWYNQLIGGGIIGQGNTYSTPPMFETDTVYVQALVANPSTLTLGTGTATNTNNSYPAPYGNFYNGAKHQLLITKAELNALGFNGGIISSLAFDVATIQGAPLQNFEIKMGHTSLAALSVGSWVANTIPVYSAASYTDILGWNTHTFTTPFVWNGSDNVVVEVCFNSSNSTNNAKTRYTTTSFNSVVFRADDVTDICSGSTSENVSVNRPTMKFQTIVSGCSSLKNSSIITVGNPPQNDAGIAEVVNPKNSVAYKKLIPVKVRIKNYGLANLTNVSIGWTLNGIQKPDYNFTGNISSGVDTIVTIANEVFNGGMNCINAWTYLPNNVLDSVSANDTLYNSCFSTCMSGEYTIGDTLGGNRDFPTFNNALNTLKYLGVCGNVAILVDSGTYNEQVRISEIPGASANSTITFRSAANDSSKVKLQFASTLYNSNYTVRLDSADFIRIEKITIKALGTTYGNVIELTNGATNNIISNNIIEMPVTTSNYYSGIYDFTVSDYYNKYQNNNILNGYYGINVYGSSTSVMIKGTEIIGNKITNYTSCGINSYYQDSIKIIGNEIIAGSSTLTVYGLYIYANNNIQIVKNKINLFTSASQYGIFINTIRGSVAKHSLIANNMISLTSILTTNPINYGIYNNYSQYLDFYYNTIHINAPSLYNNISMYGKGGSDIKYLNNNFTNTKGIALSFDSPTAITQSDYNNFYTSGTYLTVWNSASNTSLEALKAISGKDAHSISVNPLYFSQSDLHLRSTELITMGTPLTEIAEDIDGDIRNLNFPTIGADEGKMIPNDAGIISIIKPNLIQNEGDTIAVTVVVKNLGTDTIYSLPFVYTIDSLNPVNFTYNHIIPSLGTDTVSLPAFIVKTANTSICVNTILPGDSNLFNNQLCKSIYGNPLYDPQLLKILPLIEGCSLGTDTVMLLIKNNGVKTISNGLYANYQRIGESTITTEMANVIINPGDSAYYAFNTPVDLSVTNQDSIYHIKAWVTLSTDYLHANDTSSIYAESILAPSLPIVNDINIPYGTKANLSASSLNNDTLYWFDRPIAGNLLYKGNNYSSPYLVATDTFYVEASTRFTANATLGNGTVNQTYPFYTYNTDSRTEMLYKASELIAQGITTGNITSLSFDVSSNYTLAMNGFTIKMQNYTPNTLTGFNASGWQTVYAGSYTVNGTGWQSIQLQNPFIWDGKSNVLISICFDNSSYSNSTNVKTSSMSNSVCHWHQNSGSGCNDILTGSIYSDRPNIKFNINVSGCASERVAAIVTVGSQSPIDAGIIEIVSPSTAINLTNQEAVTVKIKNFGSTAIYGLTMNYQINATTAVSQLITDTIYPNDTLVKTFNQKANLILNTHAYSIKAWTTLTDDATALNDSSFKNISSLMPTYCVSSASSTADMDIVYVRLGSINNTSLPTGNLYSNFTSVAPTDLQPATTYPISVSSNFVPSSTYQYSAWLNVFIDFNRDGIFDTASASGERVFSSTTQSFNTVNGSITIPNITSVGLTRMRVVLRESGNILNTGPCGVYTWGETEDYLINLTNNPPVNSGNIIGSTTVCPRQNNVIYNIPTITHATSYVWTLPNGFTGSSNTNSISLYINDLAVSDTIKVKGVNAYGESSASMLFVAVNTSPVSGLPANLVANTPLTLTVNPGYSYLWSTGATTQSITASQTGWYSCTVSNGICSITDSSYVAVNYLPVNNGSITGNSNVCQKQSNVIYSVPAMTYATSYVWTLPNGFTGSSITNTISVNLESFAQSGTISVKGVNAYGESTSSDFNVIVNPIPVSGLPASLMICSAGQLSANPGYTYLWSTGATSQSITVNLTGWYSCTLSNGYCGTKDSTYVTVDNMPKFNCELRNDEQTSPTTYEFDIYLLNTKDCTPLEYASGAFGILLNPAVKNGGNIVAAIIANTSELNVSQIPSAAAFTASQNCIKIAAKSTPGAGNGTIIPYTGNGKRVCRIRITNSVPFGSAKPDLSWTFTTLPYQSKINAYVGMANMLLTSDTSTHTVHHLNNQLFKGIVAPISVVSDRNNLCANDSGTIVLSAIGGSGNILRWFKDSCGGNSIGSGISLTLPSPNITTTYYARWEMGVNLTTCASVTINVSPVLTASVSISTDSNLVYQNSNITFTANMLNGGSNPLIQWYKNNQLIANENGLTYSYTANNMDSVYCLLTSSLNGCLLEQTVASNIIGITTLSSAKLLDIKLYLEGFYNATTQQMNPVMNEAGAQYSEYICDSINLLLATANSPYLIEHSFGAKLKTDGSLTAAIPYTVTGNYYLVIKHRNHLETWSVSPVSFTADTVSYNFTTAISQAYGDNQKQIALTKYAIMVGDVNQDGVVDISDLVAMDYDLTDGTVAYIVYDLNGDGVVDISDLVAIDENITNGAVVITP